MAIPLEKVRKMLRWSRLERDAARRDHLRLVGVEAERRAESARSEAFAQEVAGWTGEAEAAADRAFFERYEQALQARLEGDRSRLRRAEGEAERQQGRVVEAHGRVRTWERFVDRRVDRERDEERRAWMTEMDEAALRRGPPKGAL
ncbi:hypothetical protein L6R50_05370 [Myxococcota bacterium]|nr:hypothetical protein [Myxococcota bacterium]